VVPLEPVIDRRNTLKKILLIATGGTIASIKSEEGLRPNLNADALIELVPSLKEMAQIDTEMLMNIDSSCIQPEDWSCIAEHLFERLKQYDGIVMTHGTYTLAYTSSVLTYMLQNINKPVILTGSQLPVCEDGTDAKRNLLDAFIAACEGIPGIFVVFNGKIIKGCRASKVDTRDFDAFRSINYPSIGTIYHNRVHYFHKVHAPGENTPKLLHKLYPGVFLLKLIPGTNPKVFDALKDLGYRAVVIESFGAGGVPFLKRDLLSKIHEMLGKGIYIALTTQCLYGGIDLSVCDESQKSLRKRVIPGYGMSTEALVTKLMWALGQTEDPDTVREIMSTNYADEVTINNQVNFL